MDKQKLRLYIVNKKTFRTVFKTKHARILYLELSKKDDVFTVAQCYYVDRICAGKYYAKPQRLITKAFAYNEIIDVIASELDNNFYGINFINSLSDLTANEFISYMLNEFKRGYKFLIFVGDGNTINEIPTKITTRLKNRIHRGIYLSIQYYKDNLGVIEKCCYYDRHYKARRTVIPQMLTTVFVEYKREAIIDMVNRELNCDFTDIIFITDNSIDVENNEAALCGNL